MSNNHAANITGRQANSTTTSQEKLSKGLTAGAITLPSADVYKVTVKFDSITVNDNHEGLFSGDGEYNIAAYVQGIRVYLTFASEPANCAGLGCTGGPALLDVSSGETVFFKPRTQVSIDLPGTVPLSIFTTGFEVDSCGFYGVPLASSVIVDPIQGLSLADVFKNPQLDWISAVNTFLHLAGIRAVDCLPASLDENDPLGTIVKFYNPPGHSYEPIGWGAGSHTNVVSSTGDYTLRYTISVEPKFPAKQIDSSKLSNKFQSNNTFTFKNPN